MDCIRLCIRIGVPVVRGYASCCATNNQAETFHSSGGGVWFDRTHAGNEEHSLRPWDSDVSTCDETGLREMLHMPKMTDADYGTVSSTVRERSWMLH
jgi:hypothetical protein